ncbi:alcohol oxidase [Ganoderma leucocontextum]|nr:alcohol oxidase [Ganoderma leucocontextum]
MTANLTPEQFASTMFDYIVVGGGTAGLVVAVRLSEDPNVTVGVIEAGEWEPDLPNINIPGLSGSIIANPKYDWSFLTVPQKGANGRQIYHPRGKVIGGCSATNILIYDRASAREYDAIEALGNPGWNWNEFLKYFKKAETTLPPDPDVAAKHHLRDIDPQFHGGSGPLVKSYSAHYSIGTLHDPLLETFKNLDVPLNFDANDGNKLGFTSAFATVDSRTATRTYSGKSYLEPNVDRKNLTVLTGATVTRVTFLAGSNPLQATGVEFLKGDKTYHVAVGKEVLLAAGTFQSPQILELSGIGNKDILSKHDIETLVDNPSIGENLQDHCWTYSIREIDPKHETFDQAQQPERVALAQELYQSKKGILSSAPSVIFSFVNAKTFASRKQIDQWKREVQTTASAVPQGLKKRLEKQTEWFLNDSSVEGELMLFAGFLPYANLKPPSETAHYLTIVSTVMHPLSRGSVHIASADPTAPPAIDPNYLAHPQDLQMTLSLVKLALKVFETKPLADDVRQLVAPSPEQASTDEGLIEHIKNSCSCVFHPVGTVSMLPREDGGVVDPQLRVYGTANLRVVDASILPMQLSAHTQGTVYALAEKAADIIKEL